MFNVLHARHLIGAILLIGAALILDLAMPLGFACGVLYALAVLVAGMGNQRGHIGLAGTAGAVLTAVGYLFSPPDAETAALANRLLAVLLVVSVMLFALRAQRGSDRLRDALHHERARFFDQSLDLLFIGGLDGFIRRANPASIALLEYPEDQLLRLPYLEHVVPEDRYSTWLMIQRVAQGEEVSSFQHRITTRSGALRWIEWSAPAVLPEGDVFYAAGRDITERIDQEQAVQRAEEFLRGTIDSLSSHVCILDESSKIVLVNRKWRDFAQANGVEGDGFLGANYFEICHHAAEAGDPYAPQIAEGLRQVLAGQVEFFRLEYPCHAPHEQRWFCCRITRFDHNGQQWATMSHENITQKHLAEERQARFAEVIENTSDFVAVADFDWQAHFVNRAGRRMIGIEEREEISRLAISDFHPRGVMEILEREALPAAITEGTWSGEAALLTKDGRELPVLMVLVAHRNEAGTVEYVSTVCRDLTSYKQAEQNNRTLAAIVESSQDAIIGKTLDGIVASWNRAAERIYGYQAAEIIGQPIHQLVPEDRQSEADEVLAKLQRGERLPPFETVRRRKDGRLIDVALSVSLLRDETKRAIGASIIVRDITEKRTIERRLRDQEEQLRDNEERLKQSQRMEAVGALAGGIAHEFNNLLQVISGYGNFVLDALQPDDPHYADLNQVLRAAGRAAALTDQLLSFSRRQMLLREKVDLNQLTRELAEMLRPLLGERVQFKTLLPAEPVYLECDPSQLHQALMNLCINARDAMPRGGTLCIQVAPSVCEDAASREGFVEITVSDTGEGMTPEVRQRIFDPFFTTKEVGVGTGLGLAMVYGVVSELQGRIDVESQAGRGTTFRMELPIAEPPLGQPRHVPISPAGMRQATILVAEDESLVQGFLQRVLEKAGYQVIMANNGTEAIEQFDRHESEIDLLLLDVIMPEHGGIEVAEEVRRRRPAIPVVFCTGYAPNTPEVAEILSGGMTVVRKPVDAEELLWSIQKALDCETSAEELAEDPQEFPMTTESLKALIIDDELPIRTLLIRALEEAGFQCDESADGTEARRQLQQNAYALVVTDLRMPGLNGHALCVELLQIPRRPVIAVLTGLLDPRLKQDLEGRGVDLVRTKPVNFRTFAQELRHLVDRRAPQLGGENAADPSQKFSSASGVPSTQTKHIVCILIRNLEKARQLADDLSDESTESMVAASTDDLYQFLERQRIDVLVIEEELSGFLSGLEIVERLNKQLIRPRVILLGELDEDCRERADGLCVELVKSPERELPELAHDVRRVINERTEHDAFIPPLARRLVQEFGEIPSLPQLVVKLAGYLSMPLEEISLTELANDISADSKTATELLKHTNSASTGLSRQTANVPLAVKLHGPKKTICFVLSSAALGVQASLLERWNESLRQWYQKRSVLIASTASTFAAHFEEVCPDTAFVLGLMQDVGCVILSQRYGGKYDRIVQRFREVGHTQLQHLEREAFPVDHAQVSAALLQMWRLPQSLIRPVVAHHETDARTKFSKADAGFLRVMRIGEALANIADLAHPFRSRLLDQHLSHYGQRRSSDCKAAIAEAISKTRELCELFSFPVPEAAELETILRNTSPAMHDTPATV